MAVTGWLESLRAAEKTALLQDGNSRPPASSLVLYPRPGPARRRLQEGPQSLGRRSWKGRGRHLSQVLPLQMRKLRPGEMM